MKKLKPTSLICALLALIMIAGCGSHDAETTAETGEVTTENTPQTDAITEAPGPDPADADPPSGYKALIADPGAFPLCFSYDGVEYRGFSGFTKESETTEKIDRGSRTVTVYRHPDINAKFSLTVNVFPTESAYEYVVYIENDSDTDTGVISDLRFEIEFEGEGASLRGIKGDAGGANYRSYTFNLVKQKKYSDKSTSGRPTHGVFPYYNLSHGDGGTFIAIGWPGRWHADFRYDADTAKTTLSTGQNTLNTRLLPGETVRTPLMAFVEYGSVGVDEQVNVWRHYYINDVMRKIDGELTPIYTGISSMSAGMTTSKFLLMCRAFNAHGIQPGLLWMDAGWYTGTEGETVGWPSTGTLKVDTSRFPDKLADIGKYTAEHGMRSLLWFEPESMRLDKDRFVQTQEGFEEQWLLKISGGSGLQGYLMDLGEPGCRQWIFERICDVIDTAGITGYRQDFNCDPASGWNSKYKGQKDRDGMAENQYVQGYLKLWDDIIARYPGIYMDSCASGGGRNDLESMKRAVPLHYSDWFDGNHEDYDMKSRMTQVLFEWFPYFKNEIYQVTNLYKTRMNYAPLSLLNLPSVLDRDANWELITQAYAEHDAVSRYFYADYYQLTKWSEKANRWNGWEFFDPSDNSGFAVLFCHETTKNLSYTLKLKGLDGSVTYRVKDADGLFDVTATGTELMSTGINVTVPDQPYGVLMMISEAK